MRYLSFGEIVSLHQTVISATGGSSGIRDLNALHSAVTQPHAAFGGEDLYPTLAEKAAALCFSLVMNHPFVDGNKRVGHAAMEVFLLLNGSVITASVDDAEATMLALAAGQLDGQRFVEWIRNHVHPRQDDAV